MLTKICEISFIKINIRLCNNRNITVVNVTKEKDISTFRVSRALFKLL